MFGSQALEVAIGLSLMFFILALVATSVTELASRLTKKRSKELAAALDELIGDGSPTLRARETATYKSLCSASGGAPSYMSAKAFGDLVLEILGKAREGANELSELVGNLPSGLQGRIRPLLTSAGDDLNALRAEAEGWFDDSMDRLEGLYKRWAQTILFVVGLTLAVVSNASAYGVATQMWSDPVTRAAVTEAAAGVAAGEAPAGPDTLREVAEEVDQLDETGLPVGWEGADSVWSAIDSIPDQPGGWLGSLLGWLATAFLVMLGAPFWFDLLTKLVALRGTGSRPPKAGDDPGSATSLRRIASTTSFAAVGQTGSTKDIFESLRASQLSLPSH